MQDVELPNYSVSVPSYTIIKKMFKYFKLKKKKKKKSGVLTFIKRSRISCF